MNGHDHDRRRDEPMQHELKVSGTVTHKVQISGSQADPAVLEALKRIEQFIAGLGNEAAQAIIDKHAAKLDADTKDLAANVAAGQPKE